MMHFIACVGKHSGERLDLRRILAEAFTVRRRILGIVDHAGFVRVAAGEEGTSGRGAYGCNGEGIFEPNSPSGQGVDVRSLHDGIPIAAESITPVLVCLQD
jgi:hypothetical protein